MSYEVAKQMDKLEEEKRIISNRIEGLKDTIKEEIQRKKEIDKELDILVKKL